MACNLCGSNEFVDMNGRPKARCADCGATERTRVAKVVLDKELRIRPGMSVLHIAPERGMSAFFQSMPAVQYRAVDIDPSLYRHCAVERMDLVTDAEKLPSKAYDLIMHSHVMEHIPSNVTAVLLHLHRALKNDGLHVFSIPIYSGHYDENLAPLSEEERKRRFHQEDHVRRFGRDDIPVTLGKIFKLPDPYDLEARYPDFNFSAINVRPSATQGYTSNTVFCLRKQDAFFQ